MKDLHFRLKAALFRRRIGVAEQREYLILTTALELMLKKGFDTLTFAELAKKCKVSRALVHHYFPEKQRLAERLLEICTLHLVDFVEQRLAMEKQNPQRHLETYCRANLEMCKENPAVLMGFCYFFYLCCFQQKVRKQNSDLSALGRDRIKVFLVDFGVTRELAEKATSIQVAITGAMIRLATEHHTDLERENLTKLCLRECLRLARA